MINNKKNIIYFDVLGKLFCLDVDCIKKIFNLVKVDEYPLSPSYMIGLINVHGQCVQVLDLAFLLGFERTAKYTLNAVIILCQSGNDAIALVVDKILGQTEITNDFSVDYKDKNEIKFIKKIINLKDQLIMMIDINEIIANKMINIEQQTGGSNE